MSKNKQKIKHSELLNLLAALENATKSNLNLRIGDLGLYPSYTDRTSFISGLEQHKHFIQTLFRKYPDSPEWQKKQFKTLVTYVNHKYPKLMHGENVQAMVCLCLSEWVRPLKEWKVKGKSQEKIMRSLAAHLHCEYPVPQFLFSWFEPNHGFGYKRKMITRNQNPSINGVGLNLFFYLAHGGSMRKAQANGVINVPMTKKMAHIFMNTKAKYNLVNAVRRAQVIGHGYDDVTYQKIIGVPDYVDTVGDTITEKFRKDFIQWLGLHPMLAQEQVSPLYDYIKKRRREDRTFSLSGRSPFALIVSMEAWHTEQYQDHYNWGNQNRMFEPSGLDPSTWSVTKKLKSKTGAEYEQIWVIEELLSDKELRKEGRAMHHCVGSYGDACYKGTCSIWSLRYLDPMDTTKRIATIEVRGSKIVQVRGVCNIKPEKSELRRIEKWAVSNKLKMSSYI